MAAITGYQRPEPSRVSGRIFADFHRSVAGVSLQRPKRRRIPNRPNRCSHISQEQPLEIFARVGSVESFRSLRVETEVPIVRGLATNEHRFPARPLRLAQPRTNQFGANAKARNGALSRLKATCLINSPSATATSDS